MNVTAHPSVQSRLPDIRCVWAVYDNVTIISVDPTLMGELVDEQIKIKQSLSIESLTQERGVMESRRGFKALGLDPARYRPSQEALLRSILKDQPIMSINTGVDVCNLLSVRCRVPMGLYDADKINGDILLKVGTTADVYPALNGRDVECSNKLILCDSQGPIGSPYVDSRRTAVSESCRRCLHVIYFCPTAFDRREFHAMMDTILKHINGQTHGYQSIV